jgi:GNAT superfamily N-acetyltransferase
MGIRFALDPEPTPALRDAVSRLWADVTNAGGAVGFVPPVTVEDVQPTANEAFAAVVAGDDKLLIGSDEADEIVAVLFLATDRHGLKRHWRTAKRVMVNPDHQGRGYGAALMRVAERIARAQGWTALHVTVRGGTGVERFYAALGYKEVGRLPGALRVAEGDDRDEILMWLPLTGG